MVKLPSISAATATDVPFTDTYAPVSGSLSEALITVPVYFLAIASPEVKTTAVKSVINRSFIVF